MKTTDKHLQGQLARALPPEDLASLSDVDLEAMLDAEGATHHHSHGGSASWGIAAAAAVLVLGTAVVLLRSGADDGGEKIASAQPNAETFGGVEMPAPEHVGTPEPPVAKEENWIEITPQYPKPRFTSGPLSIEGRPHLEKPASQQATFRAPRGTRLLSAGVDVTSSDGTPEIGTLAMLTDGEKQMIPESCVELAGGQQWVQLDLGEAREVRAILLWHHFKSTRVYDDVIVQLSDDPEFKGFVRTAFNNDHDNSSGMGAGGDPAWLETNHGRIIDVGGVVARYVRLYSKGNTADSANHYVEVEVFGR
jgi:hypothetical protein